MKQRLIVLAVCISIATFGSAQTDILGSHNLQTNGGGGSPITGSLPACLFCHAPHSANSGARGLWNQKLSTVTNYTLYSGTVNQEAQPLLGTVSNKCLSCHDGTVAPGQTTPYGNIQMKGAMNVGDVFSNDLSTVHPFNFATVPLSSDTPDMYSGVISGTGTQDPAVKLVDKNVQCTTCHEPHNQFIDSTDTFLVVDNSASRLCLACHLQDPGATAMAKRPSGGAPRATNGAVSGPIRESLRNGLTQWKGSAHAIGNYKTKRGSVVGRYPTLTRNGCSSCHAAHNGAKGASLLIQSKASNAANLDQNTKNCVTCHDGSDNLSPALPNILAELSKPGHPVPTDANAHSTGEKALLNSNRHATCVDCHNPHTSKQVTTYSLTTLRPSQNNATGVSENDGRTVLQPAQYQFQTCLRCHGPSTGKKVLAQFGYAPNFLANSGDPLNVLAQFGRTAISSHPVMHDRASALPQPSLLPNLRNLDGRTAGRAMGTRILCSDCHNSDESRESGGTAPNGPHGSLYPHILERRYEMSQVSPGAIAGTAIQNLYPNPSLDGNCSSKPCVSPYALCAKCHDLTKLTLPGSFSEHARHLADGFSCSTCHTSHGVGLGSSSVSGERLVNFDVNVVGSFNGEPISYNRGANSCTLVCHNHSHSGKAKSAVSGQKLVVR